ncbi:MAG: trypsin-like peptidase domain-containing protein [Prevotellaceae bacterium]|jgi:Do/DeqQ family serine protease|nr:trypsin-like peptidase domain-containing protein [Prevotellaceae bacterium]
MEIKRNSIRIAFIAGLAGGLIATAACFLLQSNNNEATEKQTVNLPVASESAPARYAAFSEAGEPVDFSEAAERSVPSVVHVKVAYKTQTYYEGGSGDLFDFFFGNPYRGQQPQVYTPRSSGSGVIISPDGYIVTNNHVIDRAEEITVIFDDKSTMIAKVVGTDPDTDIALLKVEAENLPAMAFANSDALRLGQWVLAVGNPFNLSSTVTAGIVSAKARSLDILSSDMRIEAFIQTDAAVNPGNSGGALVNLRGELVGINTAIATKTGVYEGYSFAVPSNLAKKIVEDLMQYGVPQRAMLGISYVDLNSEMGEEFAKTKEAPKNIETLKKHHGIYVREVMENGAAQEAGILSGDVITEINSKSIRSSSNLSEEIGKARPGDKVNISVIRDGKMKQFTAVLRNRAGNTDVITSSGESVLGASFKTVDADLAKKLGISGGAQISELGNGKLKQQGVRAGFIITTINQKPVRSSEDVKRVLSGITRGGIFIEGIYPNGREAYYAFGV